MDSVHKHFFSTCTQNESNMESNNPMLH